MLQVLQIAPHLSYQRFLVSGADRGHMRFHSLAGPQVLFGSYSSWRLTLAVMLCWQGPEVVFWASLLSATGLSEQLLEVEPTSSSNSSLLDISSSYSSFDFLKTKWQERKRKCYCSILDLIQGWLSEFSPCKEISWNMWTGPATEHSRV